MENKAKMANATNGDWRTGKKEVDQLHYYLTGKFYDCSFKVKCNGSGYKIFKCHKTILSMASQVFENTFSGSFKEASLGKDDPISLEKITPNAFDIAMKFIYGNCEKFEDVPTAVQVYQFAHEMQIPCLMEPLDKYLKSNTVPANVFAVLDFYTIIGNNEALEYYWEVLHSDTMAAFKSPCWPIVSPRTVEKVLQLDILLIEEAELFQFLLEWGKCQVLRDSGEFNCEDFETADVAKVREKVLPFFKYVQFVSMDPLIFSEFCKTCKVLTHEEMLKIFIAITSNSSEVLPKLLASVNDRCGKISCTLPYNLDIHAQRCNRRYGYQNGTVNFSVDKEVYLIGLQVDESDLNFGMKNLSNVTITLTDSITRSYSTFSNLAICETESSGKFINLNLTPWTLKKHNNYTLTFSNGLQNQQSHTYTRAAEMMTPLKCKGLTVTLTEQSVHVHLTKLIFKLAHTVRKPI